MIVCICTGTSDREIRRAADGGASNLAEVSGSSRAGQVCGQCRSAILEMLHPESCEECPRRQSRGGRPAPERCARN